MQTGSARVFAILIVVLLAGCGQTAEEYRVIEREYVPASEIPGIDDIDLEQVSYPVVVGSVAIAEQFPAMAWPDMVREERFRLGLSPPAELLYPRECLFVSPAPNGVGTVRKIIGGQVIFLRIHHAAEIERGECPTASDGTPEQDCFRITALSESSGMCKDDIEVDRVANFDLVSHEDRASLVYFHLDSLRVVGLRMENGCPRFDNESQPLTATGSHSGHLRVRVDEGGALHLLWYDRNRRVGPSALRYLEAGRGFQSGGEDAITVTRFADGKSANLVFVDEDVMATWLDHRFSRQFLFGVSNPSKAFLANIGKRSRPIQHLVVNQPDNDDDNALDPIISSRAHGGLWMTWALAIDDFPRGPGMETAWRDSSGTVRIASGERPIERDVKQRLLHRLGNHHRQFGRGPEGPLDPLPPACFESRMERIGASGAGVIVPGAYPTRESETDGDL